MTDELDVMYWAPSFTNVKFWTAEFKRARYSMEDDERSGRLTTTSTDNNILTKWC